LFSSGYAANVGALSALAGPGDLIVSDALNHASIIDGCRLSGAQVVVVPHLDLESARVALSSRARRRLFVTESYFSMDGDGPDMTSVASVCRQTQAIMVVDEAHALGALGPHGKGRCAEAGVEADVVIGTLGKSFGLSGAFVGGSQSLRTWLWNRARSFVFSTAIPPAIAEAAALRVAEVERADPARARLAWLSERFRDLLATELGQRPGGFGPILPVPVGRPDTTIELARRLLGEGWVVQPMRPPTVPPGSSRLRLTVRATLEDAEVEAAARAIGVAYRSVVSVAVPPPLATPEGQSLGAGAVTRDASPPNGKRLPPLTRSVSGGLPRVVAVVGTGTEVGKTHVASALVVHLVGLGLRVAGRKPIESGVSDAAAGAMGADQSRLAPTGSVLPTSPAPYRFGHPVSPHLAARLEGRAIEATVAVSWALDVDANILVVESAGGLLSPLSHRCNNLDLVERLRPDGLVLVGADRLGILHEVAAARLALEQRGLWDRTVVCLSSPLSPDASSGTNGAELRELALAEAVVEWPRATAGATSGSEAAETWRLIERAAGRST